MTSTRVDLIPVNPNRPPIIERDGWRFYISIHDAGYLAQKRSLKASMISSHPDKGGSRVKFMSSRRRLLNFLHQERCWYWKLGLMPPDWRGKLTPPQGWRRTTDKRRLLCASSSN